LILCFMRKILKTGLRTSVRLTASGKWNNLLVGDLKTKLGLPRPSNSPLPIH
jgi:hypothetical protein